MALSDRKKIILKAVVDNYIENAEPVGSKTLASKTALKLSPATLRNEMADLENMGFLEQPHTSAGRIPSNLGYRLYVDELMNSQRISKREADTIERALFRRLRELDELISEAGKLISDLTNYAAFTTISQSSNVRIRRIDLIPVDRDTFVIVIIFSSNIVKNTISKRQPEITDEQLHVITSVLNLRLFNNMPGEINEELVREVSETSGVPLSFARAIVAFICQAAQQAEQSKVYVNVATNVFDQPEYRDVNRARRLLDYLYDADSLASIPIPEPDSKMKILIGPENIQQELHQSSVVMASYDVGEGMRGMIGVVGPTRMDYSKVASRLSYFVERLNRFLNGEFTDHD
ncbi:MAG: heat-inducible transcriptional repressor HrcA [Eubacteriales bacterium]